MAMRLLVEVRAERLPHAATARFLTAQNNSAGRPGTSTVPPTDAAPA